MSDRSDFVSDLERELQDDGWTVENLGTQWADDGLGKYRGLSVYLTNDDFHIVSDVYLIQVWNVDYVNVFDSTGNRMLERGDSYDVINFFGDKVGAEEDEIEANAEAHHKADNQEMLDWTDERAQVSSVGLGEVSNALSLQLEATQQLVAEARAELITLAAASVRVEDRHTAGRLADIAVKLGADKRDLYAALELRFDN